MRSLMQVMLLAQYGEATKDLLATTLGWLLKERGVAFDVYYAAHRGGGLFSHHGGTLLGGRHHAVVARALARRPTTVVRLGPVHALDSLVRGGAGRVVDLPGGGEGFGDALAACLDALELPCPDVAVAVQTAGLPETLPFGIAQYTSTEIARRRGAAVPLELPEAGIRRLAAAGVRHAWCIATAEAARERAGAWRAGGLSLQEAEILAPHETYQALTFRLARRHLADARGVDLCEPYLASYWLPYGLREGRLQVAGESMRRAAEGVAALVRDMGDGADRVVFGRWGGGALRGCTSDEDLYALYPEGIPFQVIEPVRPVLSVLSRDPAPLPQPAQSPWDLEPPDAELRAWAEEGKILATYQTHSGELSHDDAIIYTVDLAAATGVKLGIGVQYPRYAFDPDAVEALQVPPGEGGALGLCEPVLHSTGLGIMVEHLCPPRTVAARMREARDRIARLAGERFAPRGVYCFCDADPDDWSAPQEALWGAIRDAGFEYVISTVRRGPDHASEVLYRDGDFVVLSQVGYNCYPYSPFFRVESPVQLSTMERVVGARRRPGWMIGVLDIPLYGYSRALSIPSPRHGGVSLGDLFQYMLKGGEAGRVVSATPHTIARYARLCQDLAREGASAPPPTSSATSSAAGVAR